MHEHSVAICFTSIASFLTTKPTAANVLFAGAKPTLSSNTQSKIELGNWSIVARDDEFAIEYEGTPKHVFSASDDGTMQEPTLKRARTST